MEISRKFFPVVMQDNDLIYLASLSGILNSVDEFSQLEITKTPSSYNFRLIPSVPKYTNVLIEELIKFHNILGIRLDLGKSIKTSAVITFSIEL